MNFEKYIIISGLSENELILAIQDLANLYVDTGFTKEVKIFKHQLTSNQYLINFSPATDFLRFKFFVNYLTHPLIKDTKHTVYGYWTLTASDEIIPQLYNTRIQLYVSPRDEDGDNVYAIPKNGAQTIKLGFAVGHEFEPLGVLEFDFFEKKYTPSDFISLKSIYGNKQKTRSKKTGCLSIFASITLIGFLLMLIK